MRAFAYIIAGHELHHRRMLEEKYLRNRSFGVSSSVLHVLRETAFRLGDEY